MPQIFKESQSDHKCRELNATSVDEYILTIGKRIWFRVGL